MSVRDKPEAFLYERGADFEIVGGLEELHQGALELAAVEVFGDLDWFLVNESRPTWYVQDATSNVGCFKSGRIRVSPSAKSTANTRGIHQTLTEARHCGRFPPRHRNPRARPGIS